MAEVSNAARFAIGERVRLIDPPGNGLYARIREVIGSSAPLSYRVSFEAAMGQPVYATLGEEHLEKAPPRRGR